MIPGEHRGGRSIDVTREDGEVSRLRFEADVPACASKPAREFGTTVE
jgi:hypothetical protein